VSVFVIDCTTTGCPDPICTPPTDAVTVRLRIPNDTLSPSNDSGRKLTGQEQPVAMSQDKDYPERGYNTEDVEALRSSPAPRKSFLRRHWGLFTVAALVAVPTAVMALWAAVALTFAYSTGDRVGYIQKFSEKGWLCKTYEGEIAMVNLPGQIANTFQFSVRDDSIAALINSAQGRRVALTYEQHKGVPTSCFGETEYFVKGVRVLDQ
jgi:hypothetical protein